MKFFVTSDVHSFLDELMAALNEKGFDMDNRDHILCICGDLFDRGNQAVELFEFVKELQAQDRLIYVTGNHESLLFDCMAEIQGGHLPSYHHFSNGTVDTICQFCGDGQQILLNPALRDKICESMKPVLDFMSDNCIDYAEIGDYVLVHGWIPVIPKDNSLSLYAGRRKFEQNPNWRDASWDEWEQARWINGMEMWKYTGHPEGKTIICGHFHCSWGWSHIDQKYKEFPHYTHDDFQYSFQPWIKEGIMAIDACTVYSHKCNVIVIEEDK